MLFSANVSHLLFKEIEEFLLLAVMFHYLAMYIFMGNDLLHCDIYDYCYIVLMVEILLDTMFFMIQYIFVTLLGSCTVCV